MTDRPPHEAGGAGPSAGGPSAGDQGLIVAIDGPAGVGKSTAAKLLARRLGVPYLDTGAMYRAVALKTLELGVSPEDGPRVERLAAEAEVSLAAEARSGEIELVVLLDGVPVGERIRTPEVSAATSRIATYPGVRRRLVALQREAGERWGGVVEGRDIGTRVFPDAAYKFFFEATPEVRSRRRHEELAAAGSTLSLEQVRAEIESRDRRDSSRDHSPLTRDASYHPIDTSERSAEEVVEEMLAVVRGRANL